MIAEMTALDVANASLLDEGTAAAEAVTMCFRQNKRKKLLVSDKINAQTIDVLRTRSES
jgi:glycine dehydrogenase